MYRLSIYMFVFIYYPSMVNLWVFENQIMKVSIFSLLMDTLLLLILIGLGEYYDMTENIFANIVAAIIIAVIFICCFVIRKFFTPKLFKNMDIAMQDKKDIATTKSIVEDLKKSYKRIMKTVLVISAAYFTIAIALCILHMYKVIEVNLGCPLPYIWVGILLISYVFTCSYNIKILEINYNEEVKKE